ncbi:aminoglycoside phosphotransferase family protein [Nonomuraea longicatena]|uniref:Aminoglycoside phosphotransferase domain-containing protein n=1 Tax=Nonomuraea longicatena TaxID=83682 RepID=A0ABN1PE57_9ACTN
MPVEPEVPPATGARVPWEAVHPPVRAAIEDRLGGRIVEAVTQTGGFSPAAAVRVRLADGGRAFVKAVDSATNSESTRIYRDEIRAAALLPESVPAPRLLAHVELDGWVALAFEDIEGRHPVLPWRRDELDRVRDVLRRLAAEHTPAPAGLPPVKDIFGAAFQGFRHLAGTGHDDPWVVRHLDKLVALESEWGEAAAGDALVHADVRADNILFAGDRVHLVDWPYACTGAPWFDLVGLLPSVAMQGGPEPHELLDTLDPAVTSVVAALAGFFAWQGGLPAPPGLPTLRPFQRAQGVVAMRWLRHRTGWA